MDASAVLALYDAGMRADPPAETGLITQWAGSVLRRIGVRAFIEHWTFDADGADAAVAAEAAHFRRLGQPVEWRVFSHDGPANLGAALAAAGFAPEPAETFLVFDLAEPLHAGPLPAGDRARLGAAGLGGYAGRVGAAGKHLGEQPALGGASGPRAPGDHDLAAGEVGPQRPYVHLRRPGEASFNGHGR